MAQSSASHYRRNATSVASMLVEGIELDEKDNDSHQHHNGQRQRIHARGAAHVPNEYSNNNTRVRARAHEYKRTHTRKATALPRAEDGGGNNLANLHPREKCAPWHHILPWACCSALSNNDAGRRASASRLRCATVAASSTRAEAWPEGVSSPSRRLDGSPKNRPLGKRLGGREFWDPDCCQAPASGAETPRKPPRGVNGTSHLSLPLPTPSESTRERPPPRPRQCGPSLLGFSSAATRRTRLFAVYKEGWVE
eukprot:scaffold276140_cov31-Tisochrysis_lutea.AAC.1